MALLCNLDFLVCTINNKNIFLRFKNVDLFKGLTKFLTFFSLELTQIKKDTTKNQEGTDGVANCHDRCTVASAVMWLSPIEQKHLCPVEGHPTKEHKN